jgi:transcriptional regulator with XRE-family HTH domain
MKKEMKKEISLKKVKSQREFLNYSQEYVAYELGISQPAYAKIENGKTKIKIERLIQLLKILKLELHEVLGINEFQNNVNHESTTRMLNLIENLYNDSQKNYNKTIKILEEENSRLVDIVNNFGVK